MTSLYLIAILTKILKRDGSHVDENVLKEIQETVTILVVMNPKLKTGESLLHLSLNAQTPIDDFHTNDVVQFPCVETAKLLLCCNASIHEHDHNRNTPLHTLVINVILNILTLANSNNINQIKF